ncbi:FecCD family ABC transporter permease [Comamonas kerstersii]|uniref:FecCD family ABC transporter permease n=1 Tax=Comamonas kerstersii TaxID=225992 RepID=UPI00345C9569
MLLALALVTSTLLALGIGRYWVAPQQVLTELLRLMSFQSAFSQPDAVMTLQEKLVLHIRMPRVLTALCIGASLAMSGAALQGAFRNPLVGPQILGISSGAALGGCLAIFFFSSMFAILGTSFLGGIVAIAAVYALSRVGGKNQVLVLVLAGVVTGAFFGSLLSLLTYFSDPNETLPAIVFWLMGSFATASYVKLATVIGPIAVGMAVLYLLRFRINVLSMGDEHAASLGVAVEKVRWALLACVALIVSSGVAISGTIGWVGLVVPHFARMLVGPDHRVLLPASALMGAIFMLWVDTLARSMTAAEIPLDVITSLIGAPIFALMLRKARSKGWSNA